MPLRGRENEPTLPDAIAYLFTWNTYGTWLPGDERGWVEYHHGWKLPIAPLELEAKANMTEDACILSFAERKAVEAQIQETCQCRVWQLHAINCRTNHVHSVLSTPIHPKMVRAQLKAWCTRKLKALSSETRENWWAERGSIRWIFTEPGLDAAIAYVRDGQDGPHW